MRLKESAETFLAMVEIGITLVGTLASAVGGATAVDALTAVLRRARPGPGRIASGARPGGRRADIPFAGARRAGAQGHRSPESRRLGRRCGAADLCPEPCLGRPRPGPDSLNEGCPASDEGSARTIESPFISEEDVRYLVREGAAKGIFEKTEEQLVHNVFEFADTTVREVMVPPPSIRGIDVTTPLVEVPKLVAAIGHSRIPVYRGDINHPVGILWLRDLFMQWRTVARRSCPSCSTRRCSFRRRRRSARCSGSSSSNEHWASSLMIRQRGGPHHR